MQEPVNKEEEQLRQLTEKHGQEHLFNWWPELNASQKEQLLRQIASIDFPLLDTLVNELVINNPIKDELALEPAPVIFLPKSDKDLEYAQTAREKGEAMLRNGQVAALVVAVICPKAVNASRSAPSLTPRRRTALASCFFARKKIVRTPTLVAPSTSAIWL